LSSLVPKRKKVWKNKVSHARVAANLDRSRKEVRQMARSKSTGGRKSFHVTKGSGGGWKVKSVGAKRASSTHRTQAAAIKAATKQSKATPKGQVVIHRADGSIRDERTHGSDPNPPKG
jgi:hypothetical protein